jgi:hypothetical protein
MQAFAVRAAVLMAWPVIYHLEGFARGRLRRRNPGPPPFSSINSTPADSNACLISTAAEVSQRRLGEKTIADIQKRFVSGK